MIRYSFMFFLITVIVLFITYSCSTLVELPSAESSYKESLDFNDIRDDDFINFPDTRVSVKVVHSEDSLRVWVKTDDTRTVAAFLINGLTVWLDPSGERNKNYGAIYPSASSTIIHKEAKRVRDTTEIENEDPPDFDISRLARSVKERRAVLERGESARFAERNQALVYVEDNKEINYIVTVPFSFIDISYSEEIRISVGLDSEGKQFAPRGATDRPSGRTKPRQPGRYPQDRYPSQRDQRTQQERPKSINAWMVFILNKEEQVGYSENDEAQSD